MEIISGRWNLALEAETFQQLLDTIERFVRERLRPREAEVADNDAIPATSFAT
jgi:acyl-CoA dehydrogenase